MIKIYPLKVDFKIYAFFNLSENILCIAYLWFNDFMYKLYFSSYIYSISILKFLFNIHEILSCVDKSSCKLNLLPMSIIELCCCDLKFILCMEEELWKNYEKFNWAWIAENTNYIFVNTESSPADVWLFF